MVKRKLCVTKNQFVIYRFLVRCHTLQCRACSSMWSASKVAEEERRRNEVRPVRFSTNEEFEATVARMIKKYGGIW